MYMVAIVMGKTILNALTGANSLVKVDSMPTQGQFIAIWFESGHPFSATISYDESQNHWAYLYNPITDDWDAFDDNHISMPWVNPQFYVLQNDFNGGRAISNDEGTTAFLEEQSLTQTDKEVDLVQIEVAKLTQAWRAGFLASAEGQNAEVCKLSGEYMDQWCAKEVSDLMAGALKIEWPIK